MSLFERERRFEKPVNSGKYSVHVLKADFFLVGMNVDVNVAFGHFDKDHIDRITPLHQKSAVSLACRDRYGGIGNYSAVYYRGLVIAVMLTESRLAQIAFYHESVRLALVIDELIGDLFAVNGIDRLI